MAATLENIGELERRLNIVLPSADIDSEVQQRLKRLARNVKMHGFRPGKVPLKVVAQQYAEQVRREVMGDALQKSFGDAVREQNIKVAGYPRFEPKTAPDGTAQVEFSATFEIYPEIAVGDLAQSKFSRPQTTVGDAEIDHTLEIMRKQRAAYDPVNRPAASGDKVTIDFSGTLEGVPFEGGSGSGVDVAIGEGRLLPGFESQLIGLEPGAAKKFELQFPEDYHGKEMAGKTVTFDLNLKQVAERKLPPVDAAFAQALGVADGNLQTMRDEIKANLEREVKRRVSAQLKDQIMQALIDTTKVEAPKALVEGEIDRMIEAAQKDLQSRGVKSDASAIPRDMFEAQAKRRVTLGLILAEVVKTQGLQAKTEQVRALVEEQAQSYEEPEQVVKWYYQSPERLREIESMVLEENVVEWALRTGAVEDKPTAFDELMENRK